jgi:glutamate formiminotransferase
MDMIVECVPNFSEGRRPEVIKKIAAAASRYKRIKVLDVEWDRDHNRSLVTLVGDPKQMLDAVFRMIRVATRLIDMEKHLGEHPRIGATDVVPFIPVSGLTMDQCVRMAKTLGRWVGRELKIPVYLYEAAATRSDRVNLADVRQGQYESLKEEIKTNPQRKPDFGPARMHPTAGAIVIGARKFLIAYNVNLDTKNVDIAKKIARTVREKDGGFLAVKAMGFEIKDKGYTQVSMNLCDYEKTNMGEVFEKIKEEAKKRRVKVINSEIYGLVPLEVLVDLIQKSLQSPDFKKEQILETKIWE